MTKEQWLKRIEDIEKKLNDLKEMEENDYQDLYGLTDEIDEKISEMEEKIEDLDRKVCNCDIDTVWEWVNRTAHDLAQLKHDLVNREVLDQSY